VVSAGRDVYVGREGIFLLARATIWEIMSVLSVCSVTLESRRRRRSFMYTICKLQAWSERDIVIERVSVPA
jgi:hypothetical protein